MPVYFGGAQDEVKDCDKTPIDHDILYLSGISAQHGAAVRAMLCIILHLVRDNSMLVNQDSKLGDSIIAIEN